MNFAAMLEPRSAPQWHGQSIRHALQDEPQETPKPKTPKPRESKGTLPRMSMSERNRVNLILMFNLGRAMGSN
jgi:hypothetical protein